MMYRDLHIDMGEFRADGSYMTFLLFDEQYQYGVLNAAIDPEKIRNELGWYPETSFEDGIRKTITWYLSNRAWWEELISD